MSELTGQEACPLSGQATTVVDGEFDGWTVSGPWTDGTYRIAASVITKVRSQPAEVKAKIRTWVVDQHRSGEPAPMITSGTLDLCERRRALTYDQKVERFFMMIRNIAAGYRPIRFFGLADGEAARNRGLAVAWMELVDESEIPLMLDSMQQERLLNRGGDGITIAPDGLRRIDRLDQKSALSDQVFVAMWFGAEMDPVYTGGFEPAIVANGFKPLRIDRKEHINKIDDEIIAEIRRSRFVVADFTCPLITSGDRVIAEARGGVYYEAGFAQGLGIPVVWTVRADCIAHVHFDIRQYSHVLWTNPADLAERLRNRIGAWIGQQC